jgi:hypothetical protein
MSTNPPTQKDIAEFFRLALLAGLCQPPAVAQWADTIVSAEEAPDIAFIELCCAGDQPVSALLTLLADVPGKATPGMPGQVLLGQAARLLAAQTFTADQLLPRIHGIANPEAFPANACAELTRLQDAQAFAEFPTFLAAYEPYAPAI